MSLAVVVVLCSIAFIGLGFVSYLILHHRNRFQFFKLRRCRVLLLTAHPDDEVMFFAPTVLSLLDHGYEVVLLCLSTGDFSGLGAVRREELEAAATSLGISKGDVFVEEFKDDPDLVWDATAVAECLEKYHNYHNFAAVFTFDEWGVSGHKNHISLAHGVAHFSRSLQESVNVYCLETVSLPRKYSFFLDSFFETGPRKDLYFVSSPPRVVKSILAMRRHRSQLVWFRWLYVFFSRYMFFNTYRQVAGPLHHHTLLLPLLPPSSSSSSSTAGPSLNQTLLLPLLPPSSSSGPSLHQTLLLHDDDRQNRKEL